MKESLLKPCCYCRYNSDCTTMNEALDFAKSAKMTGSYVIGLNIKCSKYYEQREPGDRISLFIHYDFGDIGNLWCTGTFIGWKGRKMIIWLDRKIETFEYRRGCPRKTQIMRCYPVHPFNKTISIHFTNKKIKLCPGGWRPENYDCRDCGANVENGKRICNSRPPGYGVKP